MFCKNCGTSMNDNEMFCPACGTKQDVAEQQAAPAFGAEATAEAKKAPFDIKGLTQHKLFKPLAAVIAVILVICIVVVPVLNSFGSAKAEFYLYATTSGELFVKYPKDKKGKEITDDLSPDAIYYVAEKELLFYVEKDDSTLYYVSLGKKELKPVKVDKDVDSYQVSSDGKTVWFKSDGDLYVSNLKDSNKIESDVGSYYINEKGTKCTYFVRDDKEEDDLEAYEVISTNKKGKTKTVAENVSNAIGSSAEEEVIFYQDKETIYSVEVGANKGKKALEVADWSEDSDLDIVSVISAKEFYYTINEEIDAMDFISDSHDAEKEMEMEWNDEEYSDDVGYRNNIRSFYDERKITSIDLHYAKGGKDKGVVVSGVSEYEIYNEGQYICVEARTVNKDAKINIDELVEAENNYDYNDENSKDADGLFNETVYGDYSRVLVIDGKANVIESAEEYKDLETYDIRVDEKGKTLYYYKDYDFEEDMAGTLYKRSISGSKLGNEKELYDDVHTYDVTEKGDVITLRDYDDGEATLYIGKKEVADDVSHFSFAQDGTILYATNAKGGTFTLNQVNGKKGVKLADDVVDYAALGKNDVMFIDEDMELFQYNKKSNKSIEDKVSVITVPSETSVSGVFYEYIDLSFSF